MKAVKENHDAKVAVLIPCYNEEQTIEPTIKGFRKALPDATIYVYNNNSTDKSSEIVEKLAKKDKNLILRHEYRQGKGNVIRSMFRDIDADCYVMTDGDDTYSPKQAPEMVAAVLNHEADMVIGDRLSSTYFTENKRPFHNFGNVLVRGLINWIFGANVRDIMTGYRAFSRPFVKGFPVLSHGFEIETEMTIHAIDKNFLLKEVTIEYQDRPAGSESKLNTYSDGFKVLKTIFKLCEEYRPLAFFGAFAAIFLIVSLILFIPIVIEYAQTGLVPRVPTLITSGVLATFALLSFLVGIILDVIVKKHRQLYELLINYSNQSDLDKNA